MPKCKCDVLIAIKILAALDIFQGDVGVGSNGEQYNDEMDLLFHSGFDGVIRS
ncbi:hypothetical protein GCM10023333_13480 [Ferrimonas pelagia]|uniref:Uncharacterized protein n=1 Tax=Ferrimonas pelagia TaxID=1177826 RepID=A0ABP9ELU7_9GAMM